MAESFRSVGNVIGCRFFASAFSDLDYSIVYWGLLFKLPATFIEFPVVRPRVSI